MGTSENDTLMWGDIIPLPPDQISERQPAVLPRPRARGRTLFREILETAVLIVVIYTLVNLVSARFVVDGHSMRPNFDTGQFIIVNRVAYLLGEPKRGDVIVLDSPEDSERDLIKRVVGLPGETITIRSEVVYVNGQPLNEPYVASPPHYSGEWVLGPGEYFVLGDNRNNSRDSHAFGPLPRDKIIGQAWIIYWPPKDWSIIPHYGYGDLSLSASAATPVPTAALPSSTQTPMPPVP